MVNLLDILKAVDNVSFKLKKGTTIGVVGESGCGKTTLGRTILKLYHPDGGEIFFNGEELTHLSKSQMQKYRTKNSINFSGSLFKFATTDDSRKYYF